MDRKEAEAQFAGIKVPCHAFIDSPSVHSIGKLLKSIENESRLHNLVSEFILYLLYMFLNQKDMKLSDELAETAFKVISATLTRSNITKFASFMKIYSILSYHFDPKPSVSKKETPPYSEEVRFEILTALSALIKFTEQSTILEFYLDQKSHQHIGLLIHLLLTELGEQKSNKILFMTLDNLMGLLHPFCETQEVRISLSKPLFATNRVYASLWSTLVCNDHYPIIRNIFKSFFPGITSKLVKFIMSDTRPSAGLISAALLVFANFVIFICNDNFPAFTRGRNEPNLDSDNSAKSTATWLEDTATKLTSLFVTATQVCIAHDNFKTRFCLLETVTSLLTHCRTSLPSMTIALIDTVIVLSSDSNQQVKSLAVKKLSSFSHLPNLTSSESTLRRIDDLSLALPKTVQDLSDTSKLPVLKLLLGYLKLIGETQLRSFSNLRARECIKNLIKVLTRVLRLDMTDNSIIAQIRIFSEFEANKLDTFKIPFTDLGEDSVSVIIEILNAIGHHCELEFLLNYMFELSENENIRKEVIFIINHVFVGDAITQPNVYISDALQSILTLYLQSEWFDDLDKGEAVLLEDASGFENQFSDSNITLLAHKHRILQQILILEGLGLFADALKKSFQPFLATVIFPLLEKSNNSNPFIQAQALYSLRKVCSALELPSIANLIHTNADYIVNVISLQFFQECTSQSALDVLQAVFRNSTPQLLPLLEDSVKYLLKSIRFYHTNDESVILIPILVVISDQLFKWQRDKTQLLNREANDLDTSPECMVKEYLKYLDFYFPTDGVGVTDMEEETGEKGTYKLEHALSSEIIESVSYYLNFITPKITSFALKIITNCFLTLSTNRDNSLNLLHRIWPQIVYCTKNSNSIILIASLESLMHLVPFYGDFLSSKIVNDLWPYFIDRLKRLVNASGKFSTYYLQTQEYKTQLAMLKYLPLLAEAIQVGFVLFHQLLAVYHPYAGGSQPKALRDTAIQGISILSRLFPDSVHFLLTLIDRKEFEHILLDKEMK